MFNKRFYYFIKKLSGIILLFSLFFIKIQAERYPQKYYICSGEEVIILDKFLRRFRITDVLLYVD